ncbi:Hypothetical predicted protein [Lecanosticta acicola]|uniref:Uncharacterized protein n=1 Tax=Lecanosticta acicola TaxID=111012 RepID=A0AAI8YUF7_9PEZI|nr:Hypothetical predicted protein [Lecanosticta acicola]
MPSSRGISISLQSQYDARTIPEWPPPPTTSTASLGSHNLDHSANNPDATPTDTTSANTAEAHIPIYRGSQLWINYTCPDPHDTSSADTMYYYFKLLIGEQCMFSWGVGEEDNWSGRVTFGIFDGGTDFEGRRVLEKRALFFPKDEGEGKGGFEIRVFRSKARKGETMRLERYDGATAGQGLHLVNSGRMRKGEPRRVYTYALIDSKDEPYAVFKYRCASSRQLQEMGVDLDGADDRDSILGIAASSENGSPSNGCHKSPPAPAVPRDDLTAANRLSFPPRLRLTPSAWRQGTQSPVKKSRAEDESAFSEEEFEALYVTETEPKSNRLPMFERLGNKHSGEEEAIGVPPAGTVKASVTGSLRGLASRFRRRGDSRDEQKGVQER